MLGEYYQILSAFASQNRRDIERFPQHYTQHPRGADKTAENKYIYSQRLAFFLILL